MTRATRDAGKTPAGPASPLSICATIPCHQQPDRKPDSNRKQSVLSVALAAHVYVHFSTAKGNLLRGKNNVEIPWDSRSGMAAAKTDAVDKLDRECNECPAGPSSHTYAGRRGMLCPWVQWQVETTSLLGSDP